MSEVFEILIAADPSRHAAYVETEQGPTNGAARQQVSKYWKHTRSRIAPLGVLLSILGGGGGLVLQAGEDIDIPDSIHGCCCPMESGQQGRSGLFKDRSVDKQLGTNLVFQTGGCSKYLLSATSRLQWHAAQQGHKSNAMLGSMLVLRLQGRP